jgi:UDP-3-O-[3-hydroxymyristoyl] glucosamine N-acyltransferase
MKLADLAALLECELRGDGNVEIRRVMPIQEAEEGDLTFLANPRYRPYLSQTRASAIIIGLGVQEAELPPLPTLRARDPYEAFARAVDVFYSPPPRFQGIHPTAVIDPSARIGHDTTIGPYCVVGPGVTIGARGYLDAHVVLYPEVHIGDDFVAHAHVVVRERVIIGNRVTLQSGCVIGGDGFGFVLRSDGSIRRITQSGTVILEDDVEIGANTTVDRAAVGATRIGRSVKIDNLVMIAHGCQVGEGSAIAAQTGLSGSTRIGRYVRLGGQVGSAGHLEVGDGAQVAAQSGLHGDVAAGSTVGGTPAVDIRLWRREVAALHRLPDVLARLRRLEKQLAGRSGNANPKGDIEEDPQ